MFVYHTNPGFPILDAGTRLVINSEKTTEWLEDREVGAETYEVAQAPQQEAHDDVYVHRPRPDAQGNVHVGLINDRLQLGLYWKFPIQDMPIVNQWQRFPQGYVCDRNRARQCECAGPRLEPQARLPASTFSLGEVRAFHLEMGVLEGEKEIHAFERRSK